MPRKVRSKRRSFSVAGLPLARRAEVIEWFQGQRFESCRLEASMLGDGCMSVTVVSLPKRLAAAAAARLDAEFTEAAFVVGPEESVEEAATRRRALEVLDS